MPLSAIVHYLPAHYNYASYESARTRRKHVQKDGLLSSRHAEVDQNAFEKSAGFTESEAAEKYWRFF